ncbi:hypothetical protein I5Q31_10595 [Serratia marcescens]|nr:hypothetical protein [Serratia marcescens]
MTLATETIKQWRSDAENIARRSCEYETEYSAAEAILALTAELLANREAQPVLYASEETLAYAKEGEKNLVTWSEPMGDAVIPLFTVPPAPTSGVVNLPTEFISDEGVVVRLEQVMAALALVGVKYERRGDACRAAMLAQPVSGGYKFPDGWKMVPVELTDDMIAPFVKHCCENESWVRHAWREMLAAAPGES